MSKSPSFKKLTSISTRFREDLEQYVDEHIVLNTDFNNPEDEFPSGCCKLSSMVFGLYLENNLKLKEVKLVNGSRKDLGTHMWVEANGLIFDLTVDQFEEMKSVESFAFPKDGFCISQNL